MRKSSLLALALLGIAAFGANAEDGPRAAPAASSKPPVTLDPSGKTEVYRLTLTEVHLAEDAELPANSAEVVKALDELRKNGKVTYTESISLSVIGEHEAMVQFGKSQYMVFGTNSFGGGAPGGGRGPMTRSYQERSVGTLVRATMDSVGDLIAADITYEASRFEGEQAEDHPRDLTNTRFTTQITAKVGATVLVGAHSTDKRKVLVLAKVEK